MSIDWSGGWTEHKVEVITTMPSSWKSDKEEVSAIVMLTTMKLLNETFYQNTEQKDTTH